MKILFWNIRGLGAAGRRKQLVELSQQHNPQCICLQETIRHSFRTRELDNFARGFPFFWVSHPPDGHSGGLLIGASKDLVEEEEEDHGVFYQSLHLRNSKNDAAWMLINVYGPELLDKIKSTPLPLIVGGDFNSVRRIEDKSSSNVNHRLMDVFNEFVEIAELRELCRGAADRVFVSNSWEDMFPLVRVQTLLRIGSDHNPLLVDTGPPKIKQARQFRFEPAWLLHEEFAPWVLSKWPLRFKQNCLDHWHVIS
ncbi:hypothetical protein PVAP13_6KG417401 [Panicum virgatum]|uniref:Endonuclease/exonuclease/phosphatase domain-containing protein n=1 Tax=Panicum virgatum TaxID=38727 RepID=A0A8T0RHD0_PANVG|nr:hypothetical protein PVAP13_6KG417401 [Panicum virgatum]